MRTEPRAELYDNIDSSSDVFGVFRWNGIMAYCKIGLEGGHVVLALRKGLGRARPSMKAWLALSMAYR